eukprot:CAMPEP_0117441816 /NCGR_PEP_ID=MMETSP0759-20121206/3829_1 /TAXON_ID=63605 /ORGANISM="Percolomonas cosmopolitus, Strain WS" /LENGTH=1043 /DNA_ID=CAMNT_0005233681 /DNA_START=171 /DNA_END=3302 /DNA_ORIENTATION=+
MTSENLSYLVSKIGSKKYNANGAAANRPKKAKQLTKPIESEVDMGYDDDIVASKFFDTTGTAKGPKKRKPKRNVDKEQHIVTLNKAKFGGPYQEAFSANVATQKPLIEFFATMVPRDLSYQEEQNFLTKSKLKLLIPYTIIFGVDEYPMMYYTDDDGFVRRVDNITTPQIIKKLTYQCGPEDLAVVQKNPLTGENVTNNAILLNAKQLKTTLENQSRGKVVFQRFVKAKGPKATITRVCWRRDAPSFAYMLSNKKSFDDPSIKEAVFRLLTNTEEPQSINIFKLKGPAIKELMNQVHQLVLYSERYGKPRAKFSEFVCDFIRDDDGRWFFIQVKGFKTIKVPAHIAAKQMTNADGELVSKNKRSRSNYMKLKECKMCLNMYPPKDLMYQMTFKMIYATESHLKQRAVKLPWFDRPEFNSVTDTSMWYEPHPVCKNCFDMYIQEQKLSKVEVEFAKAIGIPVNEKANENASILTTLSGKLNTSRKSNVAEGGATGPIPKKLQMYRFITYLNELRNIPDIIPDRFTLRMKTFKNELVIPLRVETMAQRRVLPVGKLRVYYFFAEDDEKFRKWLEEYENVTVNIFAGDERLGYANLNLSQFSSGLIDKLDYMVLFSSPKLKLCSLRATLGFVKMEPMDLSHVQLESWGGIYIPPDDFFTAHPLPDEWMEVIPQLSSQLPIDKLAKMDPTLKKNKSSARPATAPSGSIRYEPEVESADDVLQRELRGTKPVSKSQRLVMRSAKKPRRRNSNLPYGHSAAAQTTKPPRTASGRMRPLSKVFSPIYSSRLGTPSKPYRDYLYKVSRTAPPKGLTPGKTSPIRQMENLEKKQNAEDKKNQDDDDEKKIVSADEYIWSFTIKIGSVYDLSASVDDSWLMKFNLFGQEIQREYESFQLMKDGPLVFDVEDTIFFSSTETNLMNYFGKERVFKLILVPKYGGEDERTAAIDLRQFQKADNIEVVAQIEQISADEVDNTRFMEAQSDDDEFMDDEEDEGEDKKDVIEETKDANATVKVYMAITKHSRSHSNLPVQSVFSDYDLKILKPKFTLPQ